MNYPLNSKTAGKTTGFPQNVREHLSAFPFTVNNLDQSDLAKDWFKKDLSALVIDFSKWNGRMDWGKVTAKTDGAIVRAGYGNVWDSMWDINQPQLKAYPYFSGLYWYFNTGGGTGQTDKILKAIDKFKPGELHVFALDIEAAYNHKGTSFIEDPLKIMRRVRAAFPWLPVWRYHNRSIWLDWLQEDRRYKQYPLWYAWYPFDQSRQYPWTGCDTIALEDIELWQRWADGNMQGPPYGGESTSMDINNSRLTKMNFFSKYNVGVAHESPDEPNDMDELTKAVNHALAAQNELEKSITFLESHRRKE